MDLYLAAAQSTLDQWAAALRDDPQFIQVKVGPLIRSGPNEASVDVTLVVRPDSLTACHVVVTAVSI